MPADFTEGDVVRITTDWTVTESGVKYAVVGKRHSKAWGDVLDLKRIEHMPGSEYPRGYASSFRCVPADRCKRDETLSRRWKEARGLTSA